MREWRRWHVLPALRWAGGPLEAGGCWESLAVCGGGVTRLCVPTRTRWFGTVRRGHEAVGEHRGPALAPARDPGRRRGVVDDVDRPAARVPRAQLRALRGVRRLSRPAPAAHPVVCAAGGTRGAHPGHGGEPRRYPRGARLRVPGLRDGPLRRDFPARARHCAPPHRPVREKHHDDDLRLLRLDGPGGVGGRGEGGGRRADNRGVRDLSRLHGHPSDAGAPDCVDGELGGAHLDLRRTPVRDSRPGVGDPGPAGRARPRDPGRGGSLRERVLPLPARRQGPAGAA